MARLGKQERKQWSLLHEAAKHMAVEHGVKKAQHFMNEIAAIFGKPAPKLQKPNGDDLVRDYEQTNRDHDTVVHHISRSYSSLMGWKGVFVTEARAKWLNYKDQRDLDLITEKPPVIADNLKKVRRYKRFTEEPVDQSPEYGPADYAAYLNSTSAPRTALEALTGSTTGNRVGDSGNSDYAIRQALRASEKAIRVIEGKTTFTGHVPGKVRHRRSQNVVELDGKQAAVNRPSLPPSKPKPIRLGGAPGAAIAARELAKAGYTVEVIKRRKKAKPDQA